MIPAPFDAWLEGLKGREGGYSNNPADRGGETNWGVTAFVARAYGYVGDMRAMTWEQAKVIYLARYIQAPGFDRLAAVDAPLAAKLFDIGVNMGQPTGVRFVQRALNSLNRRGADWPDMKVDGQLGAMTMAAVQALIARRGNDGRRVLRAMVGAQQAARYLDLAEGDPSQEDFEFGWQLRAFTETS